MIETFFKQMIFIIFSKNLNFAAEIIVGTSYELELAWFSMFI